MLKIWGRRNSINVQKVMWCVDELGLAHERIDAGLQFGVVNDPTFRKLNPNGLVPTIDDNGVIVWESHAIIRYLASIHGAGTLWPNEPAARAAADRWMDWLYTSYFIPHRVVFWGLIRTPEEKRDMEAINAQVKVGGEALKVLDAHFHSRTFVAADHLTMGDIPIGCMVHRWFMMPIERPDVPNVEKWLSRLRERKAFADNVIMPLT
jgi:glutathione S-transferase